MRNLNKWEHAVNDLRFFLLELSYSSHLLQSLHLFQLLYSKVNFTQFRIVIRFLIACNHAWIMHH